MKGFKFKEFKKILKKNGYRLYRTNGDHYIYKKSGVNPISIPFKRCGELPRPLILRMIKENNLNINL